MGEELIVLHEHNAMTYVLYFGAFLFFSLISLTVLNISSKIMKNHPEVETVNKTLRLNAFITIIGLPIFLIAGVTATVAY